MEELCNLLLENFDEIARYDIHSDVTEINFGTGRYSISTQTPAHFTVDGLTIFHPVLYTKFMELKEKTVELATQDKCNRIINQIKQGLEMLKLQDEALFQGIKDRK